MSIRIKANMGRDMIRNSLLSKDRVYILYLVPLTFLSFYVISAYAIGLSILSESNLRTEEAFHFYHGTSPVFPGV